ncbi:MAG: Protein O-mannosyltransferase 2 [Trizodia sp. TS-e1964]|nr:MAG: Protein O-mannosyltransferase 2 [Trizodia sp. TS-e1964]
MAAPPEAYSYSTGADADAQGLKRRNVGEYSQGVNGEKIYRYEEEDVKKIKKQVGITLASVSITWTVANAGSIMQAEQSIWATLDEYEFLIAPLIFTLLAFFTRLYKIGLSPIVTWDEAHFGKFGSHYLKREFYFDVHPPLGKMLVGLSGYLAGYNGSFEFKSGETYPPELNYTFMRVFNATFGALCVPVAYYTARELNFRRLTVWLVTMMVLFENSYATISRFILLDSMLLFFTFTTVLCWARFHRLQNESFSPEWWLWVILTGISIGCVCSVKWVGFFVTALVGIYTIEDLWNKFGDLRMPKVELGAHLVARVYGFIIVPLAVYMFSFWMHFTVLENSGPGDAQMSSLFQANLRGTEVGRDSPLEIAYGSRATLKNMGYGGGLLHSHVQTYPEGSTQQQITCYHHKDANNDWFFYPNRDEPEFNADDPIKYVADKDVIRLIHAQTGRNLHSHQVAAPVTKSDWEVSCYGNTTVGDEKDHFTVEVVRDAASSDRSKIRTLTTSFRLKHTALGCYLRAGNVNLPQWGFKQIEVTCTKSNNPRDVYTHWNVESHWNEKLPPGDPGSYKSPFFRDFIHLNVAMMTSNNALVPDPDKQDDLASQFWQWPILNVGLRMCGWDDSIVKYFLLGNPVVYWGSTASLGAFVLLLVWYLVRWQRGYDELKPSDIDQIHYSGLYPVLGWVLHYLPFVAMARVTYVHHYYPALYFAILTFGFMTDHLTRPVPRNAQIAIYSVLYLLVIGLFTLFAPISFGMVGPSSQWRHLKWFDTWRMTD